MLNIQSYLKPEKQLVCLYAKKTCTARRKSGKFVIRVIHKLISLWIFIKLYQRSKPSWFAFTKAPQEIRTERFEQLGYAILNLWLLLFNHKLIYRWCQMTSKQFLALRQLEPPQKLSKIYQKWSEISNFLFVFLLLLKVTFAVFRMKPTTPIFELQKKRKDLKSS